MGNCTETNKIVKMKPKIYLAGPIRGLNYEGATSWREYAKQVFADVGIDAFSPMRAKTYLKNDTAIDSSDSNYSAFPMSVPPAVVCRDFTDATTCNALLVNLLGAKIISIGTIFEIAWGFQARIPIVLVMEKTGNVNEHMFVRQACAFQVDNLDEAIHIAKAILLP